MSQDPVSDFIGNYEKALEGALKSTEDLAQEYRVEIVWLVGLAVIWGAFIVLLDRTAMTAAIYTVLMLAIALGFPFTRRYINNTLMQSNLRRRWDRAIRHAGFKHLIPLKHFQHVHVGYQAEMRVGKGVTVKDLEMRCEQLAASMGIRNLKVRRHDHNAQWGTVTFVKTDTLEKAIQSNGHLRERMPTTFTERTGVVEGLGITVEVAETVAPAASIWQPIPVGVDEDGKLRTITLPERNLLLGGLPGSGKSIAMSQILAAVALDPQVHIWLIDWKSVEFLEFEGCAKRVAQTPEDAIDLCRELKGEMERGYTLLREASVKKIDSTVKLPIHCLFIDELAPYTDGLQSKFNERKFPRPVLKLDLVQDVDHAQPGSIK